MFCVGLTGSIASGKSTVLKLFSELGVCVISADHIAKKLTRSGQSAFNDIVQHFGFSIINEGGELNRPRLRDIIFNHPKERQWLENLLHPLIRNEIKRNVELCNKVYCIIEIPLLSDREKYPYLNRVLLVKTEQELQIQRLMKRDNCLRENALAILAAQPIPEKYQDVADDIIENDGLMAKLNMDVNKLHRKYLSYVKRTNGSVF